MNASLTLAGWREPARTNFHGILVSVVVAVAAMSLAEHYHVSAMLFALLLGMAMNFLSTEGRCVPGIQFSASTLLRIGVALLGVRITLGQITALGAMPIAMAVLSVALTIGFGVGLARLMGYRNRFGVLTGGAVAICGASAAMAIAAVIPVHADDNLKERATIFTVIGVSTLSTLAMVLYPMIVTALGLGSQQAGIFLGGTIHDVAQVVGAGYGMSQGDRRRRDDRQAVARRDAAAGDPGDHAVVPQAPCRRPGRRTQAAACCRGSWWRSRCSSPSTAPA